LKSSIFSVPPVLGILALAACAPTSDAAPATDLIPSFSVDPEWPRPLPNDWVFGQVSGLAIDANDHVWVLHRPGTLPPETRARSAPPVVELDPLGNVVRAWGGTDSELDWPDREHGIFVDDEGNVWVGSEADHLIMKFTGDGRLLTTLGERGRTGGSNDTRLLGGPQDFLVDPATNELFVADGWDNRRIVVFDAATGDYRRHWGAYGTRPDDTDPGAFDPDAPVARQFRTPVHGIALSRDGLVYAGDRHNNRIQVFRRDGTFVGEVLVAPRTTGSGSAFDIAFSPDPEQRFLFMADGTNNQVWILDRLRLEILGHLGGGGSEPGQFTALHNVVVDSRGNLFTAEVRANNRVQRFVPAE
jgi:DNA-binding beta-propeller fold protein YncE